MYANPWEEVAVNVLAPAEPDPVQTVRAECSGMVNEAIQSSRDIESNEGEFKEISDEIEQLKRRIEAIRKSQSGDSAYQKRLDKIQNIIEHREMHRYEYDDSVVRQMVECIKVHHDGKLTVIFGGGHEIEEAL